MASVRNKSDSVLNNQEFKMMPIDPFLIIYCQFCKCSHKTDPK